MRQGPPGIDTAAIEVETVDHKDINWLFRHRRDDYDALFDAIGELALWDARQLKVPIDGAVVTPRERTHLADCIVDALKYRATAKGWKTRFRTGTHSDHVTISMCRVP